MISSFFTSGEWGASLRSTTDYMKFKFFFIAFKGKRHAYSNLGYTVLGKVIERKTGQAYEEFMTGLLKSVGINQMKIGRTQKKDLDNEEVRADVLLSYSPRGKSGDAKGDQSLCGQDFLTP